MRSIFWLRVHKLKKRGINEKQAIKIVKEKLNNNKEKNTQ